jgi:hypothetical protein
VLSGASLRHPAATLALALSLCAAAIFAGATPARADDGFQRGFVLTGYKVDSYLGSRSDTAIQRMATDGSNRAAVFTQWFMDGPTSSNIAPDTLRTPSDAAILHAISVARAAGMQVTLKPQIGIRTGSWIGGAHPADLSAFWADYRTMLLHYADLAEQSGATMLVVGTEMATLSSDDAHWRPLIAEVRQHFHGALTYAANYDEYDHVSFWDALDYIGIDAYFALADQADPAPSTAALSTAWSSRGYLSRIGAFSTRTGKKVLFTEIGYRGTHTTAVHPNQWNIPDDTDTQAQANAYSAFYQSVAGQPWIAGLYWWEVNTDNWWVQDYSPLGKPAEQVMSGWNSASAQPPANPLPVDPPVPVSPPAVDVTRTPVTDPGQPPLVDTPGPQAQEPARETPQTTGAAPKAPSAQRSRLKVTLSLHRRRLRGRVAPYSRACTGALRVLTMRRVHGKWRSAGPRRKLSPTSRGRFAWRVPAGRLRVRIEFRSSCGHAKSRWVTSR